MVGVGIEGAGCTHRCHGAPTCTSHGLKSQPAARQRTGGLLPGGAGWGFGIGGLPACRERPRAGSSTHVPATRPALLHSGVRRAAASPPAHETLPASTPATTAPALTVTKQLAPGCCAPLDRSVPPPPRPPHPTRTCQRSCRLRALQDGAVLLDAAPLDQASQVLLQALGSKGGARPLRAQRAAARHHLRKAPQLQRRCTAVPDLWRQSRQGSGGGG